MKNAAVCPGEEPSFCTCGAPLVTVRGPSKPYDEQTGDPVYVYRVRCARRRWWRPFHKSYLVTTRGRVMIDEEYL